MRRIVLLLVLILIIFTSKVYSQSDNSDTTTIDLNQDKVNNVIGFVPSKARITNGLAIGWSTSISDYKTDMDSIRINGLYTNISPFQILVGGAAIALTPYVLLTRKKDDYNPFKDSTKYDTISINHKLNGASFSFFELADEFTIQGFQFTVIHSQVLKLNGFSISVFLNENKQFNGLMISGLINDSYKGKGVQIGLVNKSNKMKGIQIGLWNKIGNRGFPLINFRFKDIN